ncbi:hypothetical protein [Streptomyces mirabilis]
MSVSAGPAPEESSSDHEPPTLMGAPVNVIGASLVPDLVKVTDSEYV